MLKRFTTIMAAGIMAAAVTVPAQAATETERCSYSKFELSNNYSTLLESIGAGSLKDATGCTNYAPYSVNVVLGNSENCNGFKISDLSIFDVFQNQTENDSQTECPTEEVTEESTEAVTEEATEGVTLPSETTPPSVQQPTTGQENTTDAIVESTTAANQGGTTNVSMAQQVVNLVNKERASAGLSPVTYDANLSAAAQKRAEETVTLFSHTRPNGTSCFTVLSEFGITYRSTGENIAYGQRSAEEVMNGWMNSSGHRANILNSTYDKIGVGVYVSSNGTIYWSQLFLK